MTILLIEDSRLLRAAIARILTKAGHTVIAVGDGREGLRQAQQLHPQVILLDMMLPTLEGTGVLKMLKVNPATTNIPVFVLSGLSEKNEKKLKADGAVAFLPKSILELDREGAPLIAALQSVLVDMKADEEYVSSGWHSGSGCSNRPRG